MYVFSGVHMEQLSAKQRQSAVMNSLLRFFGREAEHCTGYHEKQWAQDQWTRGCPVNVFPTGSFSHFASVLRIPVGRIHWASTETAVECAGYMEGALGAGLRAAEEVHDVFKQIKLRKQQNSPPANGINDEPLSFASDRRSSKDLVDVSASGWNGPWCDRLPSSNRSPKFRWSIVISFVLVAMFINLFRWWWWWWR